MSDDTPNDNNANDETRATDSAPLHIPRGGPTGEERAELRALLIKLRTELARSNKDLADEALRASGQGFKVDHMADFGSDNAEQDMSLSLLEEETELLRAIDTAVRKIEGVEDLPYGLCEVCASQGGGWDTETGAPWIPTGRLRVVPYAPLCIPHQEAVELTERPGS